MRGGTYIETGNQIWRVPNKAAGATSVDSARSVGSMRVQNGREWAHSGRDRGRGGVFPAWILVGLVAYRNTPQYLNDLLQKLHL